MSTRTFSVLLDTVMAVVGAAALIGFVWLIFS